ncbi:uncharacterized protein LOC103104173 isoform X2 [Monodelphis domestica]|uniref:uncharacterized protein LOC103104173 isoform X2 n=1 Tax=Monodelphis domestica TaxID=13616 RepID=UPI0024E227F8|nr:uncharacterized protein LOC103104173 isoform X2 [Monodelphis domestica]XP_056665512.1 uncharacterized protein LOC103104173 isoform X2 [Monodelphis domestica]XP_056665513.1 uncharacterized protein LOC103104173 isoform X2 [Monodelphis domestica]
MFGERKVKERKGTPSFLMTEPWEEILLMEESLNDEHSVERTQEETDVLSFEEKESSSTSFPNRLDSDSLVCLFWENSEDPGGSSLHDASSELSVSVGYFPCYRTSEDISNSSLLQMPNSSDKTTRRADRAYSTSRDMQDTAWGAEGTHSAVGQDNKNAVSKSKTDMPGGDAKPSEDLATAQTHFLEEDLEEALEPTFPQMGFNIQQGTWRKLELNLSKSPSERLQRIKSKANERHQRRAGRSEEKPRTESWQCSLPLLNGVLGWDTWRRWGTYMLSSQEEDKEGLCCPSRESPSSSPATTQSESGSSIDSSSSSPSPRLGFSRLLYWVQQAFSRKVNPLTQNKQRNEEANEARPWGSKLWRWFLLKTLNLRKGVQSCSE